MGTQSQFAKLTEAVTTKMENGTATNADIENVVALGLRFGGSPGLRVTYKKFLDSLPNGRDPLGHLSNAQFRQLQRNYFR
jgi:hypothetical protein